MAAWRVCRDQAVAAPHLSLSFSLLVKESSQQGSGAQTAMPRPSPPPGWHLQLQRPQSGEEGEEASYVFCHTGGFLHVSRGSPSRARLRLWGTQTDS